MVAFDASLKAVYGPVELMGAELLGALIGSWVSRRDQRKAWEFLLLPCAPSEFEGKVRDSMLKI